MGHAGVRRRRYPDGRKRLPSRTHPADSRGRVHGVDGVSGLDLANQWDEFWMVAVCVHQGTVDIEHEHVPFTVLGQFDHEAAGQ